MRQARLCVINGLFGLAFLYVWPALSAWAEQMPDPASQVYERLGATLPADVVLDEEPPEDVTADLRIERSNVRPVRLFIDDEGRRADLSVNDFQHNLRLFSQPYRRFFRELRVSVMNSENLMPVFALYRPASDLCTLGLNSFPKQWRRVADKFNHFSPEDDLTVIQEVAAAHEVGHCMAARYVEGLNRRWGISKRELFADIFALMHIREQFADDDTMRQTAFDQLVRFRTGGPPDVTRPSSAQLIAVHGLLEARYPWPFGVTAVGEQLAEYVMDIMDALDDGAADAAARSLGPFEATDYSQMP